MYYGRIGAIVSHAVIVSTLEYSRAGDTFGQYAAEWICRFNKQVAHSAGHLY